jgi:hypothetical protein
VEFWTVKFWRFYWKCLSAPGRRWLAIAVILAIRLLVPLVSGKMREAEFALLPYLIDCLLYYFLPVILHCLLLGPIVEAYKLYAAKEQELDDERQMREKEKTKFEEQINNLEAKAASTEVEPPFTTRAS